MTILKNITTWRRKFGKDNYEKIGIEQKGPDAIEYLVFTDNSAIRKSVFIEVNGFNTKFRSAASEDSDLCLKLLDRNYLVYRVIIFSHFIL